MVSSCSVRQRVAGGSLYVWPGGQNPNPHPNAYKDANTYRWSYCCQSYPHCNANKDGNPYRWSYCCQPYPHRDANFYPNGNP